MTEITLLSFFPNVLEYHFRKTGRSRLIKGVFRHRHASVYVIKSSEYLSIGLSCDVLGQGHGDASDLFKFEILRKLYEKFNIELKKRNAVLNNRLIFDKLTFCLMNFSEIIFVSPVCKVSLYSLT